ncbi:hypothetical protein F4824DRAFT_456441 [Ustulina deusta]|nr:hypothetical protein F4824DRAFT_456441 [Ustulina deusta]
MLSRIPRSSLGNESLRLPWDTKTTLWPSLLRLDLGVRALWDEIKDEPTRRWGFAVFLEPDYDKMDDYLSRRDAVLFHARGAICCGETLGARWQLQRFGWPTATAKDEEGSRPSDGKFDVMRQQFIAIRDRPLKKQRMDQGTNARSGGLEAGILDNTFLVIDHESINSVMSGPGIVDDMWVWAVDPDFKSPASGAEGIKEGEEGKKGDDRFRGYMRVRLQQLTNNFFEQRQFHADVYPLARLWEASVPSKNQAFVSVNEDEAGLWCGDRSVGGAMRP